MVEDEWCFNLIVMCFCLHAKCLALCLASDYGSIFCFYLNYLKSASNLNGNLNCSKELEHYAS